RLPARGARDPHQRRGQASQRERARIRAQAVPRAVHAVARGVRADRRDRLHAVGARRAPHRRQRLARVGELPARTRGGGPVSRPPAGATGGPEGAGAAGPADAGAVGPEDAGAAGPEDAGAAESRFRIDLGYVGTDFHGWAAQPSLRTVQGVLEEGLATIVGQRVRTVVAGRTDAGVHARR